MHILFLLVSIISIFSKFEKLSKYMHILLVQYMIRKYYYFETKIMIDSFRLNYVAKRVS